MLIPDLLRRYANGFGTRLLGLFHPVFFTLRFLAERMTNAQDGEKKSGAYGGVDVPGDSLFMWFENLEK